jgi:hypothetical protein
MTTYITHMSGPYNLFTLNIALACGDNWEKGSIGKQYITLRGYKQEILRHGFPYETTQNGSIVPREMCPGCISNLPLVLLEQANL